jgi:hypothetical protein
MIDGLGNEKPPEAHLVAGRRVEEGRAIVRSRFAPILSPNSGSSPTPCA